MRCWVKKIHVRHHGLYWLWSVRGIHAMCLSSDWSFGSKSQHVCALTGHSEVSLNRSVLWLVIWKYVSMCLCSDWSFGSKSQCVCALIGHAAVSLKLVSLHRPLPFLLEVPFVVFTNIELCCNLYYHLLCQYLFIYYYFIFQYVCCMSQQTY